MPFWNDLKRTSVATGKTVRHGAAMLREHMEGLERELYEKRKRPQAQQLEKELARMHPALTGSGPRAEKVRELLAVYDELIEGAGGEPGQADIERREQLVAELDRYAIQEQLAEITRFEQSVEKMKFSRAIDEIARKKMVLAKLDKLAPLLHQAKQPDLSATATSKRQKLLADIERLNTQRASEERDYFPSGALKSRVQRYDGAKDGLSEYWYSSGSLRAKVPFVHGDLAGEVACWREDGSLLLEGKLGPASRLNIAAFLREGTRVFQLEGMLGGEGRLECWLAGREYAGPVRIEKGRLRMAGVGLFRPGAWRLLWKASKPGKDPVWLNEAREVLGQLDCFLNELVELERE